MCFLGRSAQSGTLPVEALYSKRYGEQESITLGAVRGPGDCAPSDALSMRVTTWRRVRQRDVRSLRFSARGDAAPEVDDVYVDPYGTT